MLAVCGSITPDYKPYLVYHRDRYDEDERHVVRVGCSAVREEVAS